MAWALLACVVLAAGGVIAAVVWRGRARDAARDAAAAAQAEAAALAQVRDLAAAHADELTRRQAVEAQLRIELADARTRLLERAQPGEARAQLGRLFGGGS